MTWLQNNRFIVKFMVRKETGSSAVKLIKSLMHWIKTKLVKTVSMSNAVVLRDHEKKTVNIFISKDPVC